MLNLTKNGSDSAQKILDDNPEINAMLVGHMHILVNEKQGDTVIGGPRNGGRDVVRFDITVGSDKSIVDAKVDVIDMKDTEPAQETREIEAIVELIETINFIAGGTGDMKGRSALGSTTAKFQPEIDCRYPPVV